MTDSQQEKERKSDENNNNEESTFDFIMRKGAEYGEDFGIVNAKGKSFTTKAELAQQKKEWEKTCKLMREEAKKQDPIVKYCNDIRGRVPDYELSFEEYEKLEEENSERRKRIADEEIRDWRFSDTKTSTKQERKQYRLEKKQQEKDDELKRTATAYAVFSKKWLYHRKTIS